MWIVIVEYGDKRKANAYGPFPSHDHAREWLDCWPFPTTAHKRGYFVPHSNPRHFRRATIQQLKSWLRSE